MKLQNKIIKPVKAVFNAVGAAIFQLLLLTSITIVLIGVILSLVLAAIPAILALAKVVLSVHLSSDYENFDQFLDEFFESLD